MSDCMAFPDTVEEFMEQYKIVDTEGIYMSKGAELVPIFRMKQWVEHLRETTKMMKRRTGRWYDVGSLSCRCSECGCKSLKEYSYCPNCGADMREEEQE